MSLLHPILALALLTAAPTAAPAPSVPAGAAKKRTESVIQAFKKVPADSPSPTAEQRATRERAFGELDRFLDFEELVNAPIAPRAAQLSTAELTRFRSEFRALIRLVAYPSSGEFFRQAQLKIGAEKAEAAGVVSVPVSIHVPSEDLDTEVDFVWHSKDGELRIRDIRFEGDSLVRDYQNQFARLLDKSGPAGLFKALADRRAELSKTSNP